ncbi:MAG: phosphatase PAP2 family protein [Nanopusillaceae archaeon]|jgi:membrane-associated phospholipid phosphatase
MDEREIILGIYLRTNSKERFLFSLLSYIILLIFLFYLIFINIKSLLFSIFIIFITYILKEIIKKKRPIDLFTDERTIFFDNYSFPSIHTVLSIFLIIIYHNNIVFFILLIIPILRIISLRHWISDIIYSSLLLIPFYLLYIII